MTLGQTDLKKSEAMVMEAINKGVNYFDTAYIYPGSEVALGQILSNNKVREKVFLADKLPISKCKTYEDFDKYFNIQLERLQTTYIDYYFMHMLPTPKEWERLKGLGIEKWITQKKESGQIKYVGFSFHGTQNDFLQLVDIYPWEFTMIQYNYMNKNYQAGEKGLKYANSKGLPVFIMEPLLGGSLVNNLPPKALNLFEQYPEASTPVDWALQWLWNYPEVTLVLSGMSSMSQVTENINSANKAKENSMPQEKLAVIDQVVDVFAESYKIPCTGCNYCLPCPAKINIPACFTAYNASYSMGRVTGIMQYSTTTGVTASESSSVRNCTECGKCEKACAQGIEIIARLKDVAKRMEPMWYRTGIKIVKAVMK